MSSNLKVCSIEDGLLGKLKKFRFRKDATNAAIVMKIDKDSMLVIEDPDTTDIEGLLPEELAEQLPAHQPRYVAYSYCYKHDDGRTSYPLCLIFISPQGCNPEMQMMYAGSKTTLVNEGGFTKVFELRTTEEMTEEWLRSKLGFFR